MAWTRGAGKVAGTALLGLGVLAILAAERHGPWRARFAGSAGRTAGNLLLGAMSLVVVALVERPAAAALARHAEARRRGLVQQLPAPAWVRDAAAVLLMDYTVYLWHVGTHRVPFLWRLHLVHHADLALDASTALRFHAADMAISTPFRAAQVRALGVSPRALAIWQGWFFLSVLFHHANLALPARWERRLSRLVTTPGMHAVHHTAVRDRTDANWSSGLALWDHLHGTFRAHDDSAGIGVPGYREELGVATSLALPFRRQRDAWASA